MLVWAHLVFMLDVYDKLRTRYVQMSVWVHLVFVLGVYDKLRTRYVQMSVWVHFPDSDVVFASIGLANLPDSATVHRVIDAREIGRVPRN